jgi:hypothetical protein
MSGLVGDFPGLTYGLHLKEGCRRSGLASSCNQGWFPDGMRIVKNEFTV